MQLFLQKLRAGLKGCLHSAQDHGRVSAMRLGTVKDYSHRYRIREVVLAVLSPAATVQHTRDAAIQAPDAR